MTKANPKRRPEPHADRPVIAIVGLGQMGLVCSAILSAPELRCDGPGPGSIPGTSTPGTSGHGAAPSASNTRPVRIRMWGRLSDETGPLAQTRKSPRLPGFVLPDGVEVCLKEKDALADASMIVSAVPVQYIRDVWTYIRPVVPKHVGIVSVAKGLETAALLRPTQVLAEALGDDPDAPARPLACLSGPTIAAELARCLPAAMVAASDDAEFARMIQSLFTTSWLRVYTSSDVLGVELAGAVKNVIAIAAGITDGLGAGNNAKAALLARGLAEITRLGTAMGANQETFFGVAGVGDLATTCFSPESRNRACGEALGRGESLETYLARINHVVEGVATSRALMQLAGRYRVEMPITTAVHGVLFEGLDPIEAIGRLMSREPKAEKVG